MAKNKKMTMDFVRWGAMSPQKHEEDMTCIRARQGHSIHVDVEFAEAIRLYKIPPNLLRF